MPKHEEMYKFDDQKFLLDGIKVYALRVPIEMIADKLAQKEYKNIILSGVGGTTAEMYAVCRIIEKYSDIPVYLLNAAEALAEKDRRITRNSLVLTASKSGDTPETVSLCWYAKKTGATIVSFVSMEHCPLAEASDYKIVSAEEGMENTYMRLYLFILRFLYRKGDFQNYERFADQMKSLHSDALRIKHAYDRVADANAEKYWQEPYQIWIGSDIVFGEMTLLTMCILEEMQWMRNRLVSSSEFFHGALELVEKDVMVTLVKGLGPCRALDERVEKFLQGRTQKLVIVDLEELKFTGIDEEFQYILSPIILSNVMAGRYCWNLEKHSGHDLSIRRYYRQFKY
ncbi:SIS domain-containing protein [Lactonifactor longoviformis]|uniref:Fructoselysine-6-P-deglycase FrlB with duplicated sugar isomerase (SIS) domain n=1 Tax=Lactonifactor longoviformis DSM 17459 TaxID=1122155 RepID=A0A1M4UR42_9CLOT|nr:SIS domain-containing protein [Lactonifactor longoviformis]POP31003.1 SIS domain-containing protein [Lactonifactor longoviformis]SHE59159.1 Fructoselysine-6-P-deglycase FrlB with duplicated sugar isomerase (SIS) domain [Lactonifactor longoviformis DSM 17459]